MPLPDGWFALLNAFLWRLLFEGASAFLNLYGLSAALLSTLVDLLMLSALRMSSISFMLKFISIFAPWFDDLSFCSRRNLAFLLSSLTYAYSLIPFEFSSSRDESAAWPGKRAGTAVFFSRSIRPGTPCEPAELWLCSEYVSWITWSWISICGPSG